MRFPVVLLSFLAGCFWAGSGGILQAIEPALPRPVPVEALAMTVTMDEALELPVIMEVEEDGPAAMAGLKSGDVLKAADPFDDGTWHEFDGLALGTITDILAGEADTHLKLRYLPSGELADSEPKEIILQREG